jgi:hypothetical protein
MSEPNSYVFFVVMWMIVLSMNVLLQSSPSFLTHHACVLSSLPYYAVLIMLLVVQLCPCLEPKQACKNHAT